MSRMLSRRRRSDRPPGVKGGGRAQIEGVVILKPLLLDGEPVPFVLTVTVSFSLADAGDGSVQ